MAPDASHAAGLAPLFRALARLVDGDLASFGLAWARATPVITLVPAFGLRAIPAPARGVLALALAASVYPAVHPASVTSHPLPWALAALLEMLRGLPVALATAIPLWSATMA